MMDEENDRPAKNIPIREGKNNVGLVIIVLIGAGIIGVIGVFLIIMPLWDQVMAWLKTGHMPVRDLYWATADIKCAATNWQAKGWIGKELCRSDYIKFTSWVGVDRMINFLFAQHIALITLASLTGCVLYVINFMDRRLK